MKLSQEQIDAVREWVAQDAGISEVQKRLVEKFGVNMTYMDVRFLIDDIGAELHDKPEPKPAADSSVAEQHSAQVGGDDAENGAESMADSDGMAVADADAAQSGAGSVKVSLSPIQRPGTLAGGDVVFSDGEKAEWFVDQMGRLSLSAQTQGYRPSQSDIIEFQTQLQNLLS